MTCNVALFASDEDTNKRSASPWGSPKKKRSKINSSPVLQERPASAPPGGVPLFMSGISGFKGSQDLTGRSYSSSPFDRVGSTPSPSRANSAIGFISSREKKVAMTIDDVARNNSRIAEQREWKEFSRKRLEEERIKNLLTPEEKQEVINNHIDGDAELDYAQIEPIAYKLQVMEEWRIEREERQLALQAEQCQGFICLDRSDEHRIYEYLPVVEDSQM